MPTHTPYFREHHPPSLILLDIGLPDMPGWELVHHLRQRDNTTANVILIGRGTADALKPSHYSKN